MSYVMVDQAANGPKGRGQPRSPDWKATPTSCAFPNQSRAWIGGRVIHDGARGGRWVIRSATLARHGSRSWGERGGARTLSIFSKESARRGIQPSMASPVTCSLRAFGEAHLLPAHL